MPTNSLRNTKNMIALEAFSTSDLSGLLKRAFPQMVDDLKSFIGIANPLAAAIQLTPEARAFIGNVVNKHSYMDTAPMAAWVPEGMTATYSDYLPVLQASVDHAAGVVDETLIPYCTLLSKLISNKDDQLSTQAYDYSGLEKVRDGLQAANDKCFKRGSSTAQASLGDVVKRNSEWEHILSTSNKLLDKMNKVDRKALNKKVDESAHLLDTIIKKLKNEEFTTISPQVVENLANGAYQVGKELEFFSITYYRVLSFVEAVNKTIANTTQVLAK